MDLKFDVVTPFAGKIDRILVQLGERATVGEAIFTISAAGRNYDIFSPVNGYTCSIEVEEGDQVIQGMILATVTVAKAQMEEASEGA